MPAWHRCHATGTTQPLADQGGLDVAEVLRRHRLIPTPPFQEDSINPQLA
jgi:hypothetical protein